MSELHKRRNPGIKSYDPTKVGAQYAVKQYHCPHCWFAHRAKNVLAKHINEEHWDLKNDRS